MKELTHTDCGGEIDILFVTSDRHYKLVEFKCRKCKKDFEYDEGGELY